MFVVAESMIAAVISAHACDEVENFSGRDIDCLKAVQLAVFSFHCLRGATGVVGAVEMDMGK
jgi:hypothetical protein